jgi:exopolyphosphatase/guanosine-5'-triphosphate,3'-diphosphate pyrophosphatase
VNPSGPVAAIDCGTNSTRLLVVDASGHPLRRLARITRLGQDVDRTHELRAEAISRTVEVLGEYRQVMNEFGVQRVRMTATSAARDAANREQFFEAAARVVGAAPELISGDEEGRLSFAGATGELSPGRGLLLVLDIGGGSTEFVVGQRDDHRATPLGAISENVGCVRLTERYLHHDPPAATEIDQAYANIAEHLDAVRHKLPEVGDATRLVAVAGTVVTLAAIDLLLVSQGGGAVHHHVLTQQAVGSLTSSLLSASVAERREMPGMEPARADVLAAGAMILLTVMRVLNHADCLVSEADILDGLARSLLVAT